MSEQKRDMIETRTLVELCSAGWKKYNLALPIKVRAEDGGIVLQYCSCPEYNDCKYRIKNPMKINDKEYYFCRRTR